MDQLPVGPIVMTALGAAFAGVAAGSFGILLGSVYGAALGVALSMPLFVQFGYGFGTLDRAAYFATRDGRAVVTDAAIVVVVAGATGAVAGFAATQLDVGTAVEVGLATAGAFAGGGAAYLWRAGAFHDEEVLAAG